MDCIDGNSLWMHMLTCFDEGCDDVLCRAGKSVLQHRLSCGQVGGSWPRH